jgi:ketosteroid isomerase-like protein
MRADRLLALLIVASALTPALALSPKLASDELLTIEADRLRSTVAGDFAALDFRLAEDLSYCHSNGKCETKAEYLGNLRSGSTRYRKLELVSARVRRYGDIAILNGQVRVDAEMAGNQLNGVQLAYTDVYRRERGRWRLIAWHSSRMP